MQQQAVLGGCAEDEAVSDDGRCTPIFVEAACGAGGTLDPAEERCNVPVAAAVGGVVVGLAAGVTTTVVLCMCAWVALIASRRRQRRVRVGVAESSARAPVDATAAAFSGPALLSPSRRTLRGSPTAAGRSATALEVGNVSGGRSPKSKSHWRIA